MSAPTPLKAAGGSGRRRWSEDACVAALQEVARALGSNELATDGYDRYRAERARHLPARGAIIARLGSWPEALTRVGLRQKAWAVRCRPKLQRTRQAGAEDAGVRAALVAAQAVERERAERLARERAQQRLTGELRAARAATRGELSPARYGWWLDALPPLERQRHATVAHIEQAFGCWPAALEAAGIRADDELHPLSRAPEHVGDPAYMWTTGEVRDMVADLTRLLARHGQASLTESVYERIRERSPRALPPWCLVRDCMG